MKRLLTLLLAGLASPVLAQHAGHSPPAATPAPSSAPTATCSAEHAALGHCKLPAPEVAPVPASPPAATCAPEHAAMGHCTLPASAPVPPAPAQTCLPEHAAMGHCSVPPKAVAPAVPPVPAPCSPEHAAMGHCTLPATQSSDPHAGHPMGAEVTSAPPVAPPPAQALSGPAHAADLIFDPAAMKQSRAELAEEHGGLKTSKFLIDQLEAGIGSGRETYAWDAQFWYGGDIDKLWLKSEGEGAFGGEFEGAEVQALWSRAIDPWFDLQFGIRQDVASGPDRTHLVAGVQGLAPYWFEVEGAVFLSSKGDVTARAEVEYDLRITQKLILQPRTEIDFSVQDVPELGLGSGFSTAELGARLRYEIFPRSGLAVVAPYVGVQYERAFGDTARFRRAAGEDVGGWRLLLGVRTWF